MLEQGDRAPAFDMPTNGGGRASLDALKGRTVVLYFYPKDDTSGCTIEANEFSALADEFEKAGATVIGVSPDNVASHDKFCAKHGLKHMLASDKDAEVAQAYGVWTQKSMYGRTYMGVERSTFIIDPEGEIQQAWRKVKAPGHAEAVLEAVRARNGA
jgi:peroxiredoxin Q/BCP